MDGRRFIALLREPRRRSCWPPDAVDVESMWVGVSRRAGVACSVSRTRVRRRGRPRCACRSAGGWRTPVPAPSARPEDTQRRDVVVDLGPAALAGRGDLLQRARHRVAADVTGGVVVGDVLPVPRDGQDEHHRDGLDDDRGEVADEDVAEAAFPGERDDEVRGEPEQRGDGLPHHHRDDVAVVDVGEFVGQHGLQFLVGQEVHEFRRDDDDAGAAAADGEGVRHTHVGDLEVGLLEVHLLAEPVDGVVDVGEAVPRHVLGADAPQRRPLAELILESREQDRAEEHEHERGAVRQGDDGQEHVEAEEDAPDDRHPGLESGVSHGTRGFEVGD